MAQEPSATRPAIPGWAVITPERRGHIERVAALAMQWAEAMAVGDGERQRWLRAIWLHDALRDASDEELARLAPSTPGPPELRHGPASAARAKAEGETDRSVLDAVRYHSLGLAEWDMVGRALYCADYLEPGREFARDRRAELAKRYPSDPVGVLRAVAADRVTYLVASGFPILEPTVRFWNSLAASSGSA
jgi:2-amino-4-hydroxy-6-hydroxymethyldihydropteridine diphosphokinase